MAKSVSGGAPHQRAMPWLIVAATFIGYLGLLVAIGTTGILLDVPLPWWIAQTAPPALYLLLVLGIVRPSSAVSLAGGALLLWAVHLLLGMLTEPILFVLGSPGVPSLTWAFPPSPLPELLWVPFLLLPLRDLLRGVPARATAVPRPAQNRQPVPERRTPSFSPPSPAARPIEKPVEVTPQAPPRPVMEKTPAPRPASTTVMSMEAPRRPAAPVIAAPSPQEVAVVLAPEPEPAAVTTAASAASHAQRLADDLLAKETSEEPLAVSANRILNQLPAEAFAVAADRLADELMALPALLVPRRLALSQLGEGVVRADWDVFASQIPAHLLAMSADEIRAALPGGQCVLPLDEIVRQFSPELFMPSTPAPDVRGIEVFPAPFQPLGATAVEDVIAEPEVELEVTHASAFEADVTEVVEEPAVASSAAAEELAHVDDEQPAPPDERVFELIDQIDEPAVSNVAPVAIDEPTIRDVAPVASHEPEPERVFSFESTSLVQEAAPAEWAPPAIAAARYAEPAESSVAPLSVEPEPVTAPVVAMAEVEAEPAQAVFPADPDPMRAVAAILPPVGSFALDQRVVDGYTLLTASSPALGHEVGVEAASRLLPVIAPGRTPWSIDQITLRGERAAVVITPMGPLGSGAPVLVATVAPGGGLAWLELRCRQAVSVFAAAPGLAVERAPDEERDEPDLVDVEPSTRTREIAASLGALGTVAASSLRDAEQGRALFMFLPPGSDVRAVGAFANDVSRSLSSAGETGTAFRTVLLRSGARRMVIRIPSGQADTIVAAGETAKLGLAYRQVERAAVALGAL